MDLAAVVVYEILYTIAFLALISAGLAVVFGMMRVVNLAHGEFVLLGGYAAIVSHNTLGINIFVSMLVVAPLAVAVFGVVAERLIIRFLYGRLINTMLATWGLSLAMIGAFTLIFGPTTTSIKAPIGGFAVGDYSLSGYTVFIIASAVGVVLLIFGVLKYTRAGLIARGAMQSADMASAFGYDTSKVYMVTFAAGSALSGLAGGVLAPLVGIGPTAGLLYIAKAFITVISGGASVVSGLIASSGFFGIVSQAVTFATNSVIGEIGLLVAAVILLRLLPTGISGRFFRDRL